MKKYILLIFLITELASAAPNPKSRSSQVLQMNPDMSFILNVGFGWFKEQGDLVQGGHALDYNGFGMQGLEFAASASVDPYFRFNLNFELLHQHLEEACFTTLSLPLNLQARGGYLMAPFGRQNQRHLHTWNFVNPPLSQTRFMSDEHFSSAGAEISMLMPLPWYLMIIGDVLSTNNILGLRSSSFSTVDFTKSGKIDGWEDFVYVTRVVNFFEISDDWSLNLGLNGAWGQSPFVPDNKVNLYGGDLYLKYRPISTGKGTFAFALTIEYILRDTQIPEDYIRDHGGYLQLDTQFNKYLMLGLRADYNAILKGQTPDINKIPRKQKRGSVSLTYLPTHFSKIRVQLDMGKERKKTYYAGFFQIEVSAGQHGAHRF